MGNITEAVAELDALARINPQNHRAFQRKGELLAASATSRGQLEAARQALNSALALNSEETGTLVLLGEVLLAQGKLAEADHVLLMPALQILSNERLVSAWLYCVE